MVEKSGIGSWITDKPTIFIWGVLALLLFLFGGSALIFFWSLMASPITRGQIPIWSILAIGVLVLLLTKRQRI